MSGAGAANARSPTTPGTEVRPGQSSRSRWQRDDGVSAVLVAVTVTTLIGMVAFALDIGALYAERRELQTGAEAAALAVAGACAYDEPECGPGSAFTLADQYADRNASDAAAGVDSVNLDLGARTVAVVTSTEERNGGTLLPPFFAQVLGFDGATVRAYASADWGFARALTGLLPIIFSDCEWEKFGPSIQSGPPFLGSPAVIYFHGDEEPCHASPSGQDLPGGFGWLTSNGNCATDEIEIGDWVGISTGTPPPNDCNPPDLESLVGTVVQIPFFDDIVGVGSNATYRVAGFGALYVTGYNFGGQFKEPSPKDTPCKGNDRCIAGYFTYDEDPNGEPGGEDRGIVVIRLTG